MEDYLDYQKRIAKFNIEFCKIIEDNKISEIKDLIFSDTYSNITIEEREGQIFISAFIQHHEEVLKYLIFDYGIKEDYFLEWDKNKNDITVDILGVETFQEVVRQMFKTRTLNKELNTELDNRAKNTSKKPKV
jgi:hypothetical protein